MAVFVRRIAVLISSVLGLLILASIALTLVFVYEVDTNKLEDHEIHMLRAIEIVNWFYGALYVLTLFSIGYMMYANPAYRNLVAKQQGSRFKRNLDLTK